MSHVYCSSFLRARPGSTHGYDIIDHNALNPEIGSAEEFEQFVGALQTHRMGQILDLVPNHMGVMGADNLWWMDVLENGPASVYADYFDIDWEPVDPALYRKILVPVLGDHYGLALERGEIKLAFEPQAGDFALFYFQHRFPVAPREYPRILERALRALAVQAVEATARADFESLISAFTHLPPRDATDPELIVERNRDKEVHKRHLAAMCYAHPAVAEAIEAAVQAVNGTAADARSFDTLHALLEGQPYRLAYWRVASDEINYRRFFDINDLAALRVEADGVRHLVLEPAASGKVRGLRVDHPDGSTIRAVFRPARSARGLCGGRSYATRGRAADVSGGREDRRRARAHSRELAGARHHRIPVHQRRQRPVRGHRRPHPRRSRLPLVHR